MLCRYRRTSQKNPLDDCETRHLVDTRSLHFGIKTVKKKKKKDIRSFIITLIKKKKKKEKKKPKAATFYPNTDDFDPKARLCYMSL